MTNVDFADAEKNEFSEIPLKPLAEGLPRNWNRPGLFDAYRHGIAGGVFYPALHGSTHFCFPAVQQALKRDDERGKLLRALWKAETPYIYWRMPWIGYEYWNPANNQFLDAKQQENLIRESAELFQKMFATAPFSACAPGYRANTDTRRAWQMCGIRVVQNGSGGAMPIHFDGSVLNTYRNVDFEPATEGADFSLENCLKHARTNLDSRKLLVVSVHSINFHSTLRDFRTDTLRFLDQFLSIVESEYPDLLYVHDEDLYWLARSKNGETSNAAVEVHAMPVTGRSTERS